MYNWFLLRGLAHFHFFVTSPNKYYVCGCLCVKSESFHSFQFVYRYNFKFETSSIFFNLCIATIENMVKTYQIGYRMPMAWPFLSSVRNTTVAPTTSQATSHLTATQQLLLAPRAVPRRRYLCYDNKR